MAKMTEQKLILQYQSFRAPLAAAAQNVGGFQALSKDVAAANGVKYDESVATKLAQASYGDALPAVKTAIAASIAACRALIVEAPAEMANGQDLKKNLTAEIDRIEKSVAAFMA